MPTLSEIAQLIKSYGPMSVVSAAVVYIVLRGEFAFRYPRRSLKKHLHRRS